MRTAKYSEIETPLPWVEDRYSWQKVLSFSIIEPVTKGLRDVFIATGVVFQKILLYHTGNYWQNKTILRRRGQLYLYIPQL